MRNIYRPSLKHQRPQEDQLKTFDDIDSWYKRGGNNTGPAVRKFRKGACENCGSMTHKKKDCMEVCIPIKRLIIHCACTCIITGELRYFQYERFLVTRAV